MRHKLKSHFIKISIQIPPKSSIFLKFQKFQSQWNFHISTCNSGHFHFFVHVGEALLVGVLCLSVYTVIILTLPDKRCQKIHPLPFFFYWKISPRWQIFLSHLSLFDTHLLRNLSPQSCPVISSLWGKKAVTKKRQNLKRNSSTAERKTVIHRDTYISVIHSLCISSHECSALAVINSSGSALSGLWLLQTTRCSNMKDPKNEQKVLTHVSGPLCSLQLSY